MPRRGPEGPLSLNPKPKAACMGFLSSSGEGNGLFAIVISVMKQGCTIASGECMVGSLELSVSVYIGLPNDPRLQRKPWVQ